MFRSRRILKLLFVWIVGLSITYSTLSIVRHNNFQSGGFDLGIYDQAVWQYANFQWPYNTIKDRFILGDHLTLTLPLLAPLFWLWSDARMLLVFQAFWISFSALAIYKIAFVRLRNTKLDPRVKPEDDRKNEVIAMCFAVVYSLFYGIQYLVYFDFHPVVIGVGLLAWIAYFLESGKTRWLMVSVPLLLLTQENMGLALAGLGFIYMFRQKFRKVSVIFIIVGILYSLIASQVIVLFSPVGFEYLPEIPLHPLVLVTRFFDHPEKLQVWWWSFASFSFFPLFSPGTMIAVAADLAQYFTTGDHFVQMWTPYKHHRAILGVFLTLGTLDVLMIARHFIKKVHTRYIQSKPGFEILNALKPSFRRSKLGFEGLMVLLMVGMTVLFQYVWHLPLNKLVKAEYWREAQWMRDSRELIALVPNDAAVATQQNFVPHLSHRNKIFLVWPRVHDFADKLCGQTSCWWLDFDKQAEYLVVDTRPDQWLTQILETNDHWLEAVGNMEKSGSITLTTSVGASRLYKIN